MSDVVSDLTALNIRSNDKLIASNIDNIFQQNLRVFCYGSTESVELLTEFSDEKVKKLLSTCKFSDPILEEDSVLISNKESLERAIYVESFYGFDRFQIVDLDLPVIMHVLAFQLNSPFRKEFAKMDNRISEHGLDLKWASDMKVVKPAEKNDDSDKSGNVLCIGLMCLMVFGWSVSLICFLLELAWYAIKKKLMK